MTDCRTPATATESSSDEGTTRRTVLSALGAAGIASLSGCIRETQAVLDRDSPEQVSLTIKTMPTDADPRAIRIARQLSTNLQAVGVDASVVPMSTEELYRDVLVNQSFDCYVARHPHRGNADYLRPLLHSRFHFESGWQNPFGYAEVEMDELLGRERTRRGARRRSTLRAIQRLLVRDCPFTVVAFPDELRVSRTDSFRNWGEGAVHSLQGYLSLTDAAPSSTDGSTAEPTRTPTTATPARTRTDASEPRRLRMATTDARSTESLNPLAIEFRTGGSVVDLLYDPLGRRIDGSVVPWLAESWTWADDNGGPTVRVRLRDDISWHDGESITTTDVAFTYRFLSDTSLGQFESPMPAPRFRGTSSLVDEATVLDDETVELSLRPCRRPVARRVLTAPLLPRHVWRAKAKPAAVPGVDPSRTVTEAVVWPNRHPVGSGPLRVEGIAPGKSLSLRPFEDHFLRDGNVAAPLASYAGDLPFDRLRFVVVPSGNVAVELVVSGAVDGTATNAMVEDIPQRGLPDAVQRHVRRPSSFYHVGFNVRQGPLGNPQFRRIVSRLLDREFVVETVFDGTATPATSPLARHEAAASDLAWGEGERELPFPGRNGQLDESVARELFGNAGYRYGDGNQLLEQ